MQRRPREAAIPGATAAANIVVRVGSALGAAVFAVLLQVLSRSSGQAAFADSFWWSFGILAVSLGPALLLPKR